MMQAVQTAQRLEIEGRKTGLLAPGIDNKWEYGPIMYQATQEENADMVEEKDIQSLQKQLEELKVMHLEGGLNEQEVWGVMQRASMMLDDAKGSKFQGCLEVIFHLLNSMWSNARSQSKLVALRETYG